MSERGLRLVPPQPQLNVSAHSTTSSQQGPLNSTLNGEVVDLAAEDTPNVSIQTVRAVHEMREEFACRARDNNERLELTLRQANRLHKNLLDGYLKGGSGGSVLSKRIVKEFCYVYFLNLKFAAGIKLENNKYPFLIVLLHM